ncbi:MAG: NAD(P)/FAD-dependent oxidoreductase [Magnetospiraceae bacterium]
MANIFKRIFGGGGANDAAPAPKPAAPSAPSPTPAPAAAPTPRTDLPDRVDHLIVGAGPAGVVAAETLRKFAPDATILMIGKEPEPPYSRMALPYFLTGNVDGQGTYLRPDPGYLESKHIDYRIGRVSTVDGAGHSVTLEDGSTVRYGKLLLCTGAHPIAPPIPGLEGDRVWNCWTLDDARQIERLAQPGAQVVLMGAGFIGCIILETLVERGVKLTVVEAGDRMVPRMMDPISGGLIKKWCIEKGIDVRTSTKVDRVDPTADGLLVHLDNGDQLPAQLLVVSAGVRAYTEFLEGSGIRVDSGILIDDRMQTNIPDIYAAGDCAQGLDFTTGEHEVHAIQPTATEHGRVAAQNMAGVDTVYQGSLQMNVLDTAGLISGSFGHWHGTEDTSEVLDEENYKFLRLIFEGNHLVGAVSLGRTDHLGAIRGLIQSGAPLDEWKDVLKADPHRIMDTYVGLTEKVI